MHKLYKLLLLLVFNVFTLSVNAQAAEETKGFMRSDGKIYVVLAVVLTILAGFIFYVARLDRKISRLEKSK
jgi:uncharacterized transporter YbjL